MGVQACPEDYLFLPGVAVGEEEAAGFNEGGDAAGGESGQRFCGGRLSYLNGDLVSRPITGEFQMKPHTGYLSLYSILFILQL